MDTQQAKYERALGEFLVAFNEIEHRVSDVIRSSLRHVGLADLAEMLAGQQLKQRLLTLRKLPLSWPDEDAAIFARLDALLQRRNDLAHGHLDVNPEDDSLALRTKRGWGNVELSDLAGLKAEATQLGRRLMRLQFSLFLSQNPDPPAA